MTRRLWTLLGCLSLCLVGYSSAGCSGEMSPWMRKLLGERTQICYGYGEDGEFFYLQHTLGANRGDDPRFQELVAKSFDARTKTNIPLPGGGRCWAVGENHRTVLKYTGAPLAKRPVAGEPQHDEEWEYPRVVLLFKRGRLVDVRPKGTEQPEYLWRETYIPI